MRPRDTTPEGDAIQLEIYRRMGGAARVLLAARLSNETRALSRAGIRARHPEYTEDDVEQALRRLLLGDDLYGQAWPGQPRLAP